SADVVARGVMTYNVAEQRGVVTNITTAIESGETWYVKGRTAAFVRDTSASKQTAFYAQNGIITSCDDSIPDYHFAAKEIKMVSRNIMVARPAVLYIGEVPVMWLPFIFQDMRSGRRSGMLTPRFGVSELFRNSPTYRRHVDNIGYYFALNDYMDAQLSLDWRSGARPASGDPGWVKINGEWRYRWLDRFLTGRLAISRLAQRDGTSNTSYSWGHQQDFSQSTHLTTNINYVTSTLIQRRTTFDPRTVLATIASQAALQKKIGNASVSFGGSRRQYPGREEVSQDFPNFSVSVPTVALLPWLAWTPSLNVSNNQQFKVDQVGEFAYRYFSRNGVRDSTKVQANARATVVGFETPFKIGDFTFQNSFRANDRENTSPVTIAVIDPNDPTKKVNRVFGKTFSTEIDWQPSLSLPGFFSGTWNVTPSVGIQNVDPSGFWVRTEQTGGAFIHQSKRLNYALSVAPTLYGLFPGFGSVSRFRHSVSPGLSFSYSPEAHISEEFLRALNRSSLGYLGTLPQGAITLSLSQNLEGSLKRPDTASSEGTTAGKVKLLSMNFSPVTYDFVRAQRTGKSGFTSDNFGYDLASDLFPGMRVGVQYSLFEGSPLSDTARFKPYRTSIDASFSINGQSGIFGAINRIFGRAIPSSNPQIEKLDASDDDALAQSIASTPVAGSAARNRQFAVPDTKGWQASFIFSSTRQRAPTGNGIVLSEDPSVFCAPYQVNPAEYSQCLLVQQTNPQGTQQITRLTQGGPFIRIPARETVGSQMNFSLTPLWSGSWNTIYDFQAHQFASHSVTLQRRLHDWRAIFAFTKAPNGNFAFNFFISLNAQPDLKFDYDRRSYRAPSQ
nr:LPS-assembly protein LptD [Gemmatimonadaceae bacterium]